ncbi:immunoglobulin lambda-1 light chain [Dicentrarchus labrax]|uniref:immunoglobulin lambda-1 light chain n=1 Tax=Dicentrarchus labrax TaxID=13489 RepID=UPI0021F6646E|nr:immunoglobulin lambda-1 light chain [Dicentrarchus labrax]
MTLITILIWTLACCCLRASSSQLTVSQPAVVTSSIEPTVTLTCQTNPKVKTWSDGTNRLHWYQQKSGQAPKLVMKNGKNPTSEFSSRFSGRADGENSNLTISGVQTEDAAIYYCKRYDEINSAWVFTFGGGTKLIVDLGVVRPTLTVLPPSREELQKDSATLVCLASGGFPSTWSLGWKVGGSSSSSGVSHSLEVLGRDGHYSWSSTLSFSADQWRKAGSVSCEASLSGQSPVTQTLDPDRCSE